MPEQEIERIKDKFISHLSPERIYLFGSFAEGKEREDSDFDFYIVVKDDTENIVDLTAEAYRAIRDIRSRAVDIIINTKSHFEKHKFRVGIENEVMNRGVLLYGA